MKRWLRQSGCIVAAFLLASCRDGATDPGARSQSEAVASLIVPADGQPTYYSSGVNTTYYGGYSGYDNPNAARTAVYTEELIWSAATGFWDIRDSFSPEYGPFGAESTSEPGVSQVLRTRYEITAHDRAGQLMPQPDTTLALDAQPMDSPNLARAPMDLSLKSSSGMPVGMGSYAPSTFTGRSGVDRRLVTPAAAARTLDELRRSARQVGVDGKRLTFEIARGGTRVTLTFDGEIGAVTRIASTYPNSTTSDTEYSYTQVPGAFVLTQELTRIHTPGSQPLTVSRRYSNQQAR